MVCFASLFLAAVLGFGTPILTENLRGWIRKPQVAPSPARSFRGVTLEPWEEVEAPLPDEKVHGAHWLEALLDWIDRSGWLLAASAICMAPARRYGLQSRLRQRSALRAAMDAEGLGGFVVKLALPTIEEESSSIASTPFQPTPREPDSVPVTPAPVEQVKEETECKVLPLPAQPCVPRAEPEEEAPPSDKQAPPPPPPPRVSWRRSAPSFTLSEEVYRSEELGLRCAHRAVVVPAETHTKPQAAETASATKEPKPPQPKQTRRPRFAVRSHPLPASLRPLPPLPSVAEAPDQVDESPKAPTEVMQPQPEVARSEVPIPAIRPTLPKLALPSPKAQDLGELRRRARIASKRSASLPRIGAVAPLGSPRALVCFFEEPAPVLPSLLDESSKSPRPSPRDPFSFYFDDMDYTGASGDSDSVRSWSKESFAEMDTHCHSPEENLISPSSPCSSPRCGARGSICSRESTALATDQEELAQKSWASDDDIPSQDITP
ncbi:unnamed protein product [Symbiodinium sp. CCMP2592]|nr:unnamed protein product [Symbiodinium sp. CCMP2592]